jgi:hypothetical protein
MKESHMAVTVLLDDSSEGISIQVERSRSWIDSIAGTVVPGAIAYFFVIRGLHVSTLISCVLTCCAGLLCGLIQHRPRRFKTTISKFEARVSGSLGGVYQVDRHVPLALITELQYRPGVAEDSNPPPGLYAQVDRQKNTCLVPNVDRLQAEQLIDTLHKRFGHILGSATLPRNNGFSPGDTILLNIKQL